MISNIGIGSFGSAQAAAVTGVCNDLRPCFACALEDFGKEFTLLRDPEFKRTFQLFCVLLTQYINTFGAALLAAQGIAMTVLPGKKKSETPQAVEKYTAGEVAGLLRGFGLFFIMFKVDAPDEIKEAWWTTTHKLAEWLVKRGYAPRDYCLSFGPADDDVKINAICGAGIINQDAEVQDREESDAKSVRHGEPYYVVSRVVPGKLWFLHSTGSGKCSEFGPVVVPKSVASFIKPGWGLDCKFINLGGRWYITRVEDVLPL